MIQTQWPLRWDLLSRYRLIEIIAYWEGRLTTKHLIDAFGIGRQQASKDINTYLKTIAPGNLVYDKYIKGYRPSQAFIPKLTKGQTEEYLQLVAAKQSLNDTFTDLHLGLHHAEALRVPLRNTRPEIIRALITAMREQQRLEVDYVSIVSPNRDGRIIVPHSIVNTGLRWHVRAWCEKNQDYRDFVLSRFRGEASLLGPSEHGLDGDSAWNTQIEIHVTADQRLSPAQRDVVVRDYGMLNGRLTIQSRAALAYYVLQQLNIDPNSIHAKPEAQQIVVQNLSELEPYLFH
jgi:predicted DNA-binding transcriptional regulator YafY